MYTFDSRVRYSETDEEGRLTVTGIINYMQDCSTFHSEDVGVGVGYLGEHRRIWLLSSWQIVIDRYPRLGERLTVGTWHNDFKGIYGYRNFVLRDLDGNDCVRAASVWFLYDLEKDHGCAGERSGGDLRGCLAESRGVAFTSIFIEGTEPKQAAVRPYR